MTGMLASVNSLNETQLILNTTVSIIDLKQPEQGALGALPLETVKTIVESVNKTKAISATIGDLPMQADLVCKAVAAMAETGVDYIKIGFFPGGDWATTLSSLRYFTEKKQLLIAVLFADTYPDFGIINACQEAGFAGVMLDTMDKSKGSLMQMMTLSEIERFVQTANQAKLLCGLAGSLRIEDIPVLLQLDTVDYLGFRGALCKNKKRTAQLDSASINSILNQFQLCIDA